MLKNKIADIIKVRQVQIDEDPRTFDVLDSEYLIKILTENYNKTLDFLKSATYEEIGCVSFVLEALIIHYPTIELFNCFKSRVEEFKEHDLEENWDKPSIIANSFKDEVYYAEQYLKRKGVI
ncbi:MAG: hypothetical protein R3Y05_06290 [bacterium]